MGFTHIVHCNDRQVEKLSLKLSFILMGKESLGSRNACRSSVRLPLMTDRFSDYERTQPWTSSHVHRPTLHGYPIFLKLVCILFLGKPVLQSQGCATERVMNERV